MSLGHWLEKWNRFGPDRVALVDAVSGRRLNYADLFDRAQRRALWLQARGVGAGDRVAWTARNEPEFFELLFACARLGAILVPVNWRLAPPEVKWILDNCRPTVTVGGAELAQPLDLSGPTPAVPAAEVEDATPLGKPGRSCATS